MIELKGKCNTCKVFTDNINGVTIGQLTSLLNQEAVEGNQIRIMPDVHYGKGSVIGTTMTLANGKVIPNITGVDIGCLDKDSEILTPIGWQKISEYDGREILVYDKKNDCAFFEIPYAYIKEKCNQFYHFKTSKGLDQMLSNEHKMLLWKGYKNKGYNQEIMLAEEFYEKIINMKKSDFYTTKTTFSIQNNGIDLSDDMIRIFIMISADGNIKQRKNGNCYVELHFRKQRKINRAKNLLKNANINYKESVVADGSTYIYFITNKINTKDLTVFYRASKSQLEIFIDEIFYWDGTIDEKRNHKSFSTTNKLNADVVQWVFATMGIRAGISIINNKRMKWSTIYNVYLAQNEHVSYDNKQVQIVKSEDGFKYCFTTSTGFFIMRRNNCISITGNCGMLAVKLEEKRVDLPKLDSVIRKYVPSGGNVHENAKMFKTTLDVEQLRCYGKPDARIREMLAYQSVGTLGSGNHFIELNRDKDKNLWLVIHTGSRHLGLEVCDYYQEEAYRRIKDRVNGGTKKAKVEELIIKLKAEGRHKEIKKEIEKFNKNYKEVNPSIPFELAYCEDDLFDDYIHDMKMVQSHASCNREEIARIILKEMKLHEVDRFETIHNYIDTENMILRKGSVSAQFGERLLIPINMRDGSLICIGKGNPDWNYSAPHGAGRLMSRSEAKEQISLSDFKESMNGIYTTCVGKGTIDESPMAYKPMDEIIKNIEDTVEIIDIIKPIYNFKAGDEEM